MLNTDACASLRDKSAVEFHVELPIIIVTAGVAMDAMMIAIDVVAALSHRKICEVACNDGLLFQGSGFGNL